MVLTVLGPLAGIVLAQEDPGRGRVDAEAVFWWLEEETDFLGFFQRADCQSENYTVM